MKEKEYRLKRFVPKMNRWLARFVLEKGTAVEKVLAVFAGWKEGLVRCARCSYEEQSGRMDLYMQTEGMGRSGVEQLLGGVSLGSLDLTSHDACDACSVGLCLETVLENAALGGHRLISFGDDPSAGEIEQERMKKRIREECPGGLAESKVVCARMVSNYEAKLATMSAEFEKTLAAARAEHETKVSALKQEMTKAFETQVQELKRKHKAERRELKDEVAELEDELETLRAERSKFAEDVIYRAQEVAKVRREAEEAMQARRDSMDRLEDELDEKRRTIFGLEHQLEEAKEELGAEREARRKAETDLEAEKKRKRPAVPTSREDLARATAPSDIFQYSNGRWVFTPEYQERFAALGWI